MNDADRTAITALREAAGALHVGDRAEGARGSLSAEGMPVVAGEVGQLLDAIVDLLRTVDLDPLPATSDEHAMHALAQHLVTASGAARRCASRP